MCPKTVFASLVNHHFPYERPYGNTPHSHPDLFWSSWRWLMVSWSAPCLLHWSSPEHFFKARSLWDRLYSTRKFVLFHHLHEIQLVFIDVSASNSSYFYLFVLVEQILGHSERKLAPSIVNTAERRPQEIHGSILVNFKPCSSHVPLICPFSHHFPAMSICARGTSWSNDQTWRNFSLLPATSLQSHGM